MRLLVAQAGGKKLFPKKVPVLELLYRGDPATALRYFGDSTHY